MDCYKIYKESLVFSIQLKQIWKPDYCSKEGQQFFKAEKNGYYLLPFWGKNQLKAITKVWIPLQDFTGLKSHQLNSFISYICWNCKIAMDKSWLISLHCNNNNLWQRAYTCIFHTVWTLLLLAVHSDGNTCSQNMCNRPTCGYIIDSK